MDASPRPAGLIQRYREALLFLYRELLEGDLDFDGVVRARSRRRLPVVLTPEEVRAVLDRLTGVEALVAGLLYGSAATAGA